MALELADILRLAQDNTRLGTAQQLVAAEGDDVHTGLYALLHGGLVVDTELFQIHQGAAAQVLNDRQALLPAQGNQFVQRHGLGKAHDLEVAGMYFQKRPGLRADGIFIVSQVGLVGGAHFPEGTAALDHDLRNPEGTADLHQLSPGGNDFTALAQGTEDQQHGGGVVVDHHGCLGAGDLADQGLDVVVAGATLALGQVIFQSGVTPGYGGHCIGSPLAQTGPA